MMLEVIVDHTAERGKIRVHPADKDLMDRTALAIDSGVPSTTDDAAKVIDRLLVMLRPNGTGNLHELYNAEIAALEWLNKHDHPALSLTVATRDKMEKLK
jgi:hypothetical protein